MADGDVVLQKALGVSVRCVHGLLARSPHSFSRLVARRRVQRAQELDDRGGVTAPTLVWSV